MLEELKRTIGNDEKVMWEGKPDKKCFIFESIFNPLLPFALLWGIIDFSVIGTFLKFGDMTSELTNNTSFPVPMFLIGFFALHLMPVWIYLGGILLTRKRYKNTAYIITDKAIYVSSGIISKVINRKPFAELSHVNLHRGFFDQKFDVGDIILSSTTSVSGNGTVMGGISISSISEYNMVYDMVRKIQTDIYSDTMYPNDMRPKENHGYNTEYKGM